MARLLLSSIFLLQGSDAFVRPLVRISSNGHAAWLDLREFSGQLRSSWYDDDTPATPLKKKKKKKKRNPAASGESFADREERKAVKKWEKLQVKKEVQRTRRKRHRGHGKDGTMSEYLNKGKGGSGVSNDGGVGGGGAGNKNEFGVELSPWEQPVVGVAGGAEGGALRLRRKQFNVNEVRGFNFVGGRCVGACLAAYFLLYCYGN